MFSKTDVNRHEHHCLGCVYLGSIQVEGHGQVDWYRCGNGNGTLLGRYGSDGPEYWSMPERIIETAIKEQGPDGVTRLMVVGYAISLLTTGRGL